jgi:CubicO group peptidase (beta-lactamase class C family)
MKGRYYYLLLLIALTASSCHVARFVIYNKAGMSDYKKFPSMEIKTTKPVFKFAELLPPKNISLPQNITKLEFIDFNDFLLKTKTLSFLVIKNDSIYFERYYSDNTEESIFTSFSASKSFVSALIGIAIAEGYIKDVNEPVTNYLTYFKDSRFKEITIEHLLNMKSGIDFKEQYLNPFGDVAKYYYGTHLQKYLRQLKIKEKPGVRYEYLSVNSLLLSEILEKATGVKISDYLQEKIWKPIGMEWDASWSIDSKKGQTIKSFCCINAHTRDYAKFGRLYLNKGKWNNKQIIPEEWIKKSTEFCKDSTSQFYYNYQWRVCNKGDFFAKGVMGQFIYVYPAKNVIIVRNGSEYGIENWLDVFRQIADSI